MSIIEWLGILRFCTESYTYMSGQDMPARLLVDDLYDAEINPQKRGL